MLILKVDSEVVAAADVAVDSAVAVEVVLVVVAAADVVADSEAVVAAVDEAAVSVVAVVVVMVVVVTVVTKRLSSMTRQYFCACFSTSLFSPISTPRVFFFFFFLILGSIFTLFLSTCCT